MQQRGRTPVITFLRAFSSSSSSLSSPPPVHIKAQFYRGGTSKCVLFHEKDLQEYVQQSKRAGYAAVDVDSVLLAVMGSPDPFGRQLNGLGGGISSLSKVIIIHKSTTSGKNSSSTTPVLEYSFGQVSVKQAKVEYEGICGNGTSAASVFGASLQLQASSKDSRANGKNNEIVNLYNRNTGVSVNAVVGNQLEEDTVTAGVAGLGNRVQMNFDQPGGSSGRGLLPLSLTPALSADQVNTSLTLDGGKTVTVSCVDASVPCVFVRGSDFNVTGSESTAHLNAKPELLAQLERVRKQAAVAMGIGISKNAAGKVECNNDALPKICLVCPPISFTTATDQEIVAEKQSLSIRALSLGVFHLASPLTVAMCAAAACLIPSSIPHALAKLNNNNNNNEKQAGEQFVHLAHPSGTTTIVVKYSSSASPSTTAIESTGCLRTARLLMDGLVQVTPEDCLFAKKT